MPLELALAREAAQHAADEAVGAGRERVDDARRPRRRRPAPRRPARPRSGARGSRPPAGATCATVADARRGAPATAATSANSDQRRRPPIRAAAAGTCRAWNRLALMRDLLRRPRRWRGAIADRASRSAPAAVAAARPSCPRQRLGEDRRRRAPHPAPRAASAPAAQPPRPGMRPEQQIGDPAGRRRASAGCRRCRRGRPSAPRSRSRERQVQRHRQRDAELHHHAPVGDRVDACVRATRARPAAPSDRRRRAQARPTRPERDRDRGRDARRPARPQAATTRRAAAK